MLQLHEASLMPPVSVFNSKLASEHMHWAALRQATLSLPVGKISIDHQQHARVATVVHSRKAMEMFRMHL